MWIKILPDYVPGVNGARNHGKGGLHKMMQSNKKLFFLHNFETRAPPGHTFIERLGPCHGCHAELRPTLVLYAESVVSCPGARTK